MNWPKAFGVALVVIIPGSLVIGAVVMLAGLLVARLTKRGDE